MNQSKGLLLRQFLRFTRGDLGVGLTDAPHESRIGQNFQCLLKALEILDAEHDGGRAAVLGDDDAAVFALNSLHDLGQAVLHVCEG